MATVIFSSKLNVLLASQFDSIATRRGIARNAALKEAIARYVEENLPSIEKTTEAA